jgi:hypothetical protein
MAVNETRNLTVELRNGITDGSVKRQAPDRGGSVEGDHTNEVLQSQYGALTYGSAAEVDYMANRLHDGKICGPAEQGEPDHQWFNTVETPRVARPPLPSGVALPSTR